MTFRTERAARGAVVALTGAAVLAFGTPAMADEVTPETEQPPGYEAPASPEIDPDSPGLMLGDGAELAPARVLDIKFITEDLGGGADEGDEQGGGGESDPPPSGGEDEGEGGGQQPNGGDGGQREEQVGSTRKFTLQTDVIFGEGSSEVTPETEEALAEVAAAIEEYRPDRVNVFGFTDDQGSYESGRSLSDERASNTHQALLGLIEDPSAIVFNVRGYSEDYPLYDNATEDGRQRNRRVEISWPTGE
ncbi:OmpA family protein [Streptomyces avicenniae]|uniref:OmpA family protein n=1 Tax=Streptomyces avicenniae TaxID=500153 RepID=UPI000AB19CFC|nr:OmpA family protein [Streptomyces avicenniae]